MDVIKLEAQPREVGTKAARHLRRDGRVPCVLYGRTTDPVTFSLDALQVRPLIYTTRTNRVELAVNGGSYDCILKDVDFHPVSDKVLHADFQALTEGEAITLTVPVRYRGIPVGQVDGGDTQFILTDVEIRCLPKDIPSSIEVDVSELAIGDSLHVEDLEMEGIDFVSPGRQTLVTVVPPSLEVLDEVEEEGVALEGEEAVAEEGEDVGETAEGTADEEGAGSTA